MPELSAAVKGRTDVVLVTVAINGSPRQFRAASRNLSAPVLLDRRHQALNAFGVRAVPTTFVLNSNGHVDKRFIGGYHKADFVQALDRLK